MDIKTTLRNIKNEYQKDVQDMDLDSVYIKYLGKKGAFNQLFQELKNVSQGARVEAAKDINKLKDFIDQELKLKRTGDSIQEEKDIDLTIPVSSSDAGNIHPTTAVARELCQFFHYYGFSVYDGPEIEKDYYNFEMLGVPKNHPARELQDTLYLMEPEILLRTQTSSTESRELERQNPPIRFVSAGRVYRNETANKSNASFFHQFQGVYVDRNVTLGQLKWILEKALKFILGEDTEIRFRPKYYPEVEPGMGPDIKCKFCNGKGCDFCKQRGWVEIAGSGMIHPETLEKAGISSVEYSGFAFGWGLDRIAMTKYNIKDIRDLYDGSLIYK